MALITRVTRLFRSDLHAVLDHIEEPGILLKQAVREMQDCVEQDQRSIKLHEHEQKQLLSREDELEQSLSQIESELDVCFESNKEDLARVLTKRKLEVLRLVRVLGRRRQALDSELQELQARYQENQARLSAMQQKVELLTEHDTIGGDSAGATTAWDNIDSAIADEDVEIAFLKEKQRRVNS